MEMVILVIAAHEVQRVQQRAVVWGAEGVILDSKHKVNRSLMCNPKLIKTRTKIRKKKLLEKRRGHHLRGLDSCRFDYASYRRGHVRVA